MNYEFYNDYELVYLIKENSEEAIEMIIKKYDPIIYNIASYYIQNFKNYKLELDDLIQEGRLALIIAISKFDSKKDILFYTFAIICIKRKMLNMIRINKNNKNYTLNLAISIDDENNYLNLTDNTEPSLFIIENDLVNKLINFKNNLNDVDSMIFELRFNEFSYSEISILLDINKKTVDNKLLKIRKMLKNFLFNTV